MAYLRDFSCIFLDYGKLWNLKSGQQTAQPQFPTIHIKIKIHYNNMWSIPSHKNQLNTCTIPLGSFLTGCLLQRTLPSYLTCQCLKEYPQSPTYCHWHTADTTLWSCTRMLAMMSVYFGKDSEFSDVATILQTREILKLLQWRMECITWHYNDHMTLV